MNQNSLLLNEFSSIISSFKDYLSYQKELGIEGLQLSRGTSKMFDNYQETKKITLEDIRSDLGDCRRCKLHKTRRNIVFGEGNSRAKLVFVGEGPGRDEDLQGTPFVGKAGQLLARIIESIHLTREEVYIANIIKCRPPENRNPDPDEIAACQPFLASQLEAIRPKIICALGNFASQSLLRTGESISHLRGRFHNFHGIKLMPTYHPAFLLRNPDNKREVWQDMQMIQKEYQKF